jgi:hypothetical protein
MLRTIWLVSVLALSALLVWAAEPASLDFVHMSDTHVTAFEGIHPDIVATLASKREATAHLAAALRRMGEGTPPAFVLITGDLIEGHGFVAALGNDVKGQQEAFAAIVKTSPVQVMLTLGNHDLTRYRPGPDKTKAVGDYTAASEAREAWRKALAPLRDGTYYSFKREVGRTSYLFLMLDDGEPNGRNPEFAAAQVKWIREQLAAHRNGPVVVAMHIPLPQAPYAKDIQDALGTSPRVAMIVAGHRHSDGIEVVETGARKVTQVRTAALFLSDRNCRRVRLFEDRIEVFATGRPEERVETVKLEGVAAAAGR